MKSPLRGVGKIEGPVAPLFFIVIRYLNSRILCAAAMNVLHIKNRGIWFRGPIAERYQQFKIAEADEAARRIRGEAGRAVAVQFACIEESPGSAEQDAG